MTQYDLDDFKLPVTSLSTLQKAIEEAVKTVMFEFNDEQTRKSFCDAASKVLRDAQSRRVIYTWSLICDETNNTDSDIEFFALIRVRQHEHSRTIQWDIKLKRTGVRFEEINAATQEAQAQQRRRRKQRERE